MRINTCLKQRVFADESSPKMERRRRTLPDNRVVRRLPHPFKMGVTPYTQADFSPAAKSQAYSNKSALALKMAKVIVVGDCGVGKTSLIQRYDRETCKVLTYV